MEFLNNENISFENISILKKNKKFYKINIYF